MHLGFLAQTCCIPLVVFLPVSRFIDTREKWSSFRKGPKLVKDALWQIAPPAERAAAQKAPRRWVWAQRWTNLLFLHWQVPVHVLLPHVPSGVTIDTHDGRAWVSLVLFRLTVRPRWLPFVPGISNFNELNLRTYVTCQDQTGIAFLSMHADNHWAIRLARWLTPLPYVPARIRYQEASAGFSFDCCSSVQPHCRLSLHFSPRGDSRRPEPDSLDDWLLERYRLFIAGKGRRLEMATVAHPRWTVRRARVTIAANTIGGPLGLELSRTADLAHFSAGVEARFGAFQRAARQKDALSVGPAASGQPT